jgi:hypothetical protein
MKNIILEILTVFLVAIIPAGFGQEEPTNQVFR